MFTHIFKYTLTIFIFAFTARIYGQELNPEKIYEAVNPSVVVVNVLDSGGKIFSQGSGVVYDEGLVVTNFHVIKGYNTIVINHGDSVIREVSLAGADIDNDIAVLKIRTGVLKPLKVLSAAPKVGQRIYAIGSPLGYENSISEGIISGLRNMIEKNQSFIQVSSPISKGSSGGAIVNSRGELIGISTFTEKSGQNINFAIPVADVLKVIPVHKSPADKKIYLEKAKEEFEKNNFNNTLIYASIHLNAFDNDAEAYFIKGLSYYNIFEQASDIDIGNKAIEELTNAVRYNSDYEQAYEVRGKTYSAISYYTKAVEDFTEAIRLRPGNPIYYYNRSAAYFELGDMESALKDLNHAITLNPNYSDAYAKRAEIFYRKNIYGSVIQDYETAITIAPEVAKYYVARGNFYFELSKYDKALADWYKAIELEPELKNLLNYNILQAKKELND
jgi:tetratricopeptide (TPR) repeat protein